MRAPIEASAVKASPVAQCQYPWWASDKVSRKPRSSMTARTLFPMVVAAKTCRLEMPVAKASWWDDLAATLVLIRAEMTKVHNTRGALRQ